MKVTNYVAGFLFSPDFKNVVLIEKNKPNWQKGKYNGIGGKIEPYETAWEAMVREFQEETDLEITDWKYYCKITGEDYSVSFFYATAKNWDKHFSVTDEEVFNIPVADMHTVRHFLIENLNWLIPLAIDKGTSFSGRIDVESLTSSPIGN